VDLKAERRQGYLRVLAAHYEDASAARDREAVRSAVERHADAVGLRPVS
jgi:hypothetical protein